MDKEVVVRDYLTRDMTEAGEKLILRLDKMMSDVEAAFWLFYPEEKIWKLIIISNLVKTGGPRTFYKKILDANKQADEHESILSLNDIGVADTSHPLVNLLSRAVSTGSGISGIRLSGNAINGTFIEDAYIYRIDLKKSINQANE
jgi:hypothetical protein